MPFKIVMLAAATSFVAMGCLSGNELEVGSNSSTRDELIEEPALRLEDDNPAFQNLAPENLADFIRPKIEAGADQDVTAQQRRLVESILTHPQGVRGVTFEDRPFELLCSIELCLFEYPLDGMAPLDEMQFKQAVTGPAALPSGGLVGTASNPRVHVVVKRLHDKATIPME